MHVSSDNRQISELSDPALRETLVGLRGSVISALVFPGNRGDGVILEGGRSLLRACGLEWSEVSAFEAPRETDVLLVFSNGAFHGNERVFPRLVENHGRGCSRVILLPGTFDGSHPALAHYFRTLDTRHRVFCRERESLRRLAALRGDWGDRLRLSRDLAFEADLSPWTDRPRSGAIGIFRRDCERSTRGKPQGLPTEDASDGRLDDPGGLLDVVARHEEIHTDRCHAAICGARLGRTVYVYPNSYYKNAAIYEYCLSGMRNVRFCGDHGVSASEFLASTAGRVLNRARHRLRFLLGR